MTTGYKKHKIKYDIAQALIRAKIATRMSQVEAARKIHTT